MFNKIAETERAEVLSEQAKIAQVFAILGKDSATELEILRVANGAGLMLSNIRQYCTAKADGTLGLKK